MADINDNMYGDFTQSPIIRQLDFLTANLVKYTTKAGECARRLSSINYQKKFQVAEEAKADFLANIRHDFCTPLAGIVGISKVLQKHECDPQRKEAIDAIVSSSEQILSLLTRLLELDNIDSGRRPVHSTEVKIYEVVEETQKILAAAIKNKDLKMLININKDVPACLITDRYRLLMILLNLLSNAIKFTEKGRIKISIELFEKEKDKGKLWVEIEDSGIGIPQNKISFIFRKFNKLTPSYAGNNGFGLGLYLVRKFVEELSGTIKVNSKVGQGTQFICILPFGLP